MSRTKSRRRGSTISKKSNAMNRHLRLLARAISRTVRQTSKYANQSIAGISEWL